MHKSFLLLNYHSPGAGKTTCANAAVNLIRTGVGCDFDPRKYQCLPLDLDVCVPQWMRDNFSQGIYPTLEQRGTFMLDACEYINGEINDALKNVADQTELITIISFSFVNTDLRAAFRDVFPGAQWILVDTQKQLSEERIQAREGHFYKNASTSDENNNDNNNEAKEALSNNTVDDNSEWEFRPVDFPHTVLDGRDTVEDNAKRIVECIVQSQM